MRFLIIKILLADMALRKPALGSVKLNCDVALKTRGGDASVGVIARNDSGELIDGHFKRFRAASALQGELEAIRLACLMALDMNLSLVEIESDNKTAITSVFQNWFLLGRSQNWFWTSRKWHAEEASLSPGLQEQGTEQPTM